MKLHVPAPDTIDPVEPSDLRLRFFGQFAVTCREIPLPKMRTRKEQWLLALLVLHASEKPVEREWLATRLWPETLESSAQYNLRRSLGVLRDALASESARILSPTARTLRIDLDGADCDVTRFDSAVRRGGNAANAVIASLHRAPLLLGCEEEWILEPRASRLRAAVAALEALAHGAGEGGDTAKAAEYLSRSLGLDPRRESALRSLMKLQVSLGNHAAAIELFRDFRRRLKRDLDAEPDPETVRLHGRIVQGMRRSSPSAGPPAPSKRSIQARDSAMPVTIGPLIGRDDACVELLSLLQAHRLLTLVGSGGVGKTRLSLAVADSVAAIFGDGVFFVDLSRISDPNLLALELFKTLLPAARLEGAPTDAIIDHLRSLEVLIVLDNCEHVLSACSELVGRLIDECGRVRILATSREALRMPFESVWRVPSLSQDDAVQLFLQRTAYIRPGFNPTPPTRTAVSQICRRLDGIPLAIEMAAAWMRAMPAPQIAAHLDDAFRLLTSAGDDRIPRHRTLRATLEWSYGLLSPEERRLLARLSIFAGGWTLEAAEAVCAFDEAAAPSQILETLVSLVDRSLVVYREDDEATGRYLLLETTRAYAAEQLPSVEREPLQSALLTYLQQLAEKAKPYYGGPEEQTWLNRLDIEMPNIRAALSPPIPEDAMCAALDLQLPTVLLRLWWRRAHLAEGVQFLSKAFERRASRTESETYAAALNARGVLEDRLGHWEAAIDDLRGAVAIRRTLGDERGLAASLHNLGTLYASRKDYGNALAACNECVAIYRRLGDTQRAATNQTIADEVIDLLGGELPAAPAGSQSMLEAAARSGDQVSESALFSHFGLRALRAGSLREARDNYRRSLGIRLELRHKILIPDTLEALAVVLAGLGRDRDLPKLYGAAWALRQAIARPVVEVNREPYEANQRQSRVLLGDAVFAEMWAEGAAMSFEDAAKYALDPSRD